jgi:hypothetical protein
MGTERGRLIALGGLVLVLLAVIYRTWTSTAVVPAPASKGSAAGPQSARASAAAASTAPEVHLDALDQERPKPAPTDRNLFRFKERALPPAPARVAPAVAPRTVPTVLSGPPPPPPIPLKFIGIIEAPQPSARLAALVDSTGHPYHGAEGDVIAGQYRILKIGVESIEMAYLDGRGRQTILLSGS